jgi:hypothetical protein
MSETAPGHVFISYVREDAAAADELQAVLEAAGIPVWRDTQDLWPGENWRAKIRRAISDEALVFLACFSRTSRARQVSYQNEELALAIEQMRLRRSSDAWLIPVRFDDSEIPDLALGSGLTLASIQRCDFFGSRRDPEAARLVKAVRRVLARGAAVPTRRSSRSDVDFLLDKAGSAEGGLQALVISVEDDAGFAQDLGNSLLGLGAEFPLTSVGLFTVGSEDARPPGGQAHPIIHEADIVLLVVSRDLLATEYGRSPDVGVLLNRHASGEAIVLPVIFRAASWRRQPFGGLVALPANGVSVREWPSLDEALRSITDSLAIAIQDFLGRGSAPSWWEAWQSRRQATRNLGEVFKFSGVPGLTFVEPRDFQAFRMALRQPGLGIVLEGPSGIGKTTILKHAVEQDVDRLGAVRVLSARRAADIAQIEQLPNGHTGLVAVDDFHRLPGPLQDEIADYLKLLADDDAAAKLVVVGIPGTAQNLVTLGADLATRIQVFRPERAADSLVREMIEKGEKALNVRFAAKSDIIVKSVGSLQTAQMLCWQLVTAAGVEQTADKTVSIPTDIARALDNVTGTLRRKYQPMVDQFATLDEPAESLCIDLLLDLAKADDGILRLDALSDAEPELREVIQRVFVRGMPTGFCGGNAGIAEHLYYDPRGRRLIADDPELIFYLRQLNRSDLLETAGKELPAIRDQVFVCYSHQDAHWLDRLQIHLKPLERDGLIDLWSDRRLGLGDDWRRGIKAALARAKVALLLVSADFLASDFIQEAELPELLRAAEQGGCRIIPILVGPSLFLDTPDLARFQTANGNQATLSEMKFEESESILLKLARWLKDLYGPQ